MNGISENWNIGLLKQSVVAAAVHCFIAGCFMMLSCNCFAQEKALHSYPLRIPLKKGITLVFLIKEKGTDLYQQPRIKTKQTLRKIDGFDEHNFSSSRIRLSPNGYFLMLEHIIKGYIQQSGNDSVFHENYGCVIVDLRKVKVVDYLQSNCDGSWNSNNEWISSGNIIFRSTNVKATEKPRKIQRSDFVRWLNATIKSASMRPGSKLLMHHFPRTWKVPGYSKNFMTPDIHTRYTDSLNYLLHHSVEAPIQNQFYADSILQAILFAKLRQKNIHLCSFPDSTIFYARLINQKSLTNLFSITATGKIDYPNFENERHQTVEIWLSVSKDSIAGRLLVAYETGDDLHKQMRYYYLDQRRHLFLKDFSIDELSISQDQQQTWLINAKNRMTKVK